MELYVPNTHPSSPPTRWVPLALQASLAHTKREVPW